MSSYQSIDLSKLKVPDLVEELDFETIFEEMLEALQEFDPAFDALVESDPAYAILQVCAYRELSIRQTINDKAKACMVAYATGTDLDNLAANLGVTRLNKETDDALRARTILAPEGWSTAGPIEAYRFYALSAHDDIKGVNVASGGAGVVKVAVLSKNGSGACYGARIDHTGGYAAGATEIAVAELTANIPSGTVLSFENGSTFTLNADAAIEDTRLTGLLNGAVLNEERAGILPFVEDVLNVDSVRPLNDILSMVSAQIIEYTVEAELTLYDGPDTEVVRQAAEEAVREYVETQHKIGRDITLSGLYAALHQDGCQEVVLVSPAARIEVADDQAAYCTAVKVSVAGRDE